MQLIAVTSVLHLKAKAFSSRRSKAAAFPKRGLETKAETAAPPPLLGPDKTCFG